MEGKKEEQLGFIFVIEPITDLNGNIIDWYSRSENLGVRDEIILTMMRTWLRGEEDKYFNQMFNQS